MKFYLFLEMPEVRIKKVWNVKDSEENRRYIGSTREGK